jgi:hypothetical protein
VSPPGKILPGEGTKHLWKPPSFVCGSVERGKEIVLVAMDA